MVFRNGFVVVAVILMNLCYIGSLTSALQIRWPPQETSGDSGNLRSGQVEAFAPTPNQWRKTCSSTRNLQNTPLLRNQLGLLMCQELGFDRLVSITFGTATGLQTLVDIVSCPANATDISQCRFSEIAPRGCGPIRLTCTELSAQPLPAPTNETNSYEISCDITRRMTVPIGPRIHGVFRRSTISFNNQCSMEFLPQKGVYLKLESRSITINPTTSPGITSALCNAINHVIIRQTIEYPRMDGSTVPVRETRESTFCGLQDVTREVLISPVATSVNITFVRKLTQAGVDQFDIRLRAIPQIAATCGHAYLNVSIVKQKLLGWINGTWTAQVVDQSPTPPAPNPQCTATQSETQSRSNEFFDVGFDARNCPRVFQSDTDDFAYAYQLLVARKEFVDVGKVQIEYADRFLLPIKCHLKLDEGGMVLQDVNGGPVAPLETLTETVVVPYRIKTYRDSLFQMPFEHVTFPDENIPEKVFYLLVKPNEDTGIVQHATTEVVRCFAKNQNNPAQTDVLLYDNGRPITGIQSETSTMASGLQTLQLRINVREITFPSGVYDFICEIRSGFGNPIIAYHSINGSIL